MAKILVLGATGYIGGRLVPRLAQRGHAVRCLVRDLNKSRQKPWADDVELFEGDVLNSDTLTEAFRGVSAVYYLIHSMGADEDRFAQLDRTAAENVRAAAEQSGVNRIIYLGGLGRREDQTSRHLRSRHEVGEILREGSVPVTEFRAAIIVGSGSVSFEMIHHLVNRLPLMICPRWVVTHTQPIAIRDVLAYLVQALDTPDSAGRIIDIGGPDILTYRDMMLATARVLGLRRILIQVPVLTPRLSSYWVNLVTPIPASVARPLIEGLRHETVVENDLATELFDIKPIGFKDAVRRAFRRVKQYDIETYWTDASWRPPQRAIDDSHLKEDVQEVAVERSAEELFAVVQSIGGRNGWYYGSWLWSIRGFIDKNVGGVGLRRGRRHPNDIAIGDALDFWRVEEFEPGKRLLLRAEMKVFGGAWLEFIVTPTGSDSSRLTQQATYYPKGVLGLLYWYGVFPLHWFVFRGMAKAIGRRAEAGKK